MLLDAGAADALPNAGDSGVLARYPSSLRVAEAVHNTICQLGAGYAAEVKI
jgi:hypothetical protein